MPRTKGQPSAPQVRYPSRVQDGTPLADRVAATIGDGLLAPVEERVDDLESDVQALIERGIAQTALIALAAGRHGGMTYVEPAGGFSEDAVGQPVLVAQGPSGDADEGGIVLFTGQVIDQRRMVVRWCSWFPAPATVNIVYLVS